jgi:hypothetical protein
MLRGINSGMGLSIYLGHARPKGWVGYYGIRIHHLQAYKNEPMGAVLSICCHTASRKRTGISFSENLVYQGLAASSFGAVTATKHTDNTKWAVNLTEGVLRGYQTIGELLMASLPQHKSAISAYRLIGDPLAPVGSTDAAIALAEEIKIYE